MFIVGREDCIWRCLRVTPVEGTVDSGVVKKLLDMLRLDGATWEIRKVSNNTFLAVD